MWTEPARVDDAIRASARGGGEEEDQLPPSHEVVKTAPVQETEVASLDPPPEPEPEPVEIRTGEEIVSKNLVPIDERKPKTLLSNDDRRKMAHENLKAVSKALIAYMRDKKQLPPTYFEANGFRTLSWRVEILPYLGYDELYKQFDKSVPWNRPPNDKLLQYIPDQYVSPERFDTKTNIMMPSCEGFVGGERGKRSPESVEDGLNNTLLLVEANDRHSTEWTAPNDFTPESRSAARRGLLGLRKDGAFGAWANGWSVLLAKELPEKLFWDAMTIDAGDGLQAGRIHRDISIKNVTDAAVAAVEETPEPEAIPMPDLRPPPAIVNVVRDDVPSAGRLAEVQNRFRGLFAEKLKDAKTDDEKLKLANDLLDAAVEMSEDPVGAYALQTAAMRVAIDGGGVQELIAAIDQRVGQFEVDAYEENKTWLLAFGKGLAKRDTETLEGTEYTKRAVKVIFAGIHDDDFVDALALGRYSYRLVDQRRDEAIPKYLNQLRGLLGSAKREFDSASEALADYRMDPNDGEAAATVGRYVCFIKGDWRKGLPLLTQGGPEALQEMAARDMQGADDLTNKIAIGDAWWDLSEHARSGVYRQSARQRAVFWYEQAYPLMSDSLDRMHVKSRLNEANDAPPSSPLALVTELAEELGVDLRVGLAAVAEAGQQRARARDRDDEDDDD